MEMRAEYGKRNMKAECSLKEVLQTCVKEEETEFRKKGIQYGEAF